MTTFRDQRVTPRKAHWCVWCGRTLAVGEQHRAVTFKGDDGVVTQRSCDQCEAVLAAVYAYDREMMWEEYWDLGEYITENTVVDSPLRAGFYGRWDSFDVESVRVLATAALPPRPVRAS